MVSENNTLSRREALKRSAAVAGVAAFTTPTVVGVFSTTASAAQCNPETESFVISGTVIPGTDWNTNCGGTTPGGVGRYVGQFRTVTLQDANETVVQVRVGIEGNDNFPTDRSYYQIISDSFNCTATWIVTQCGTNEVQKQSQNLDNTWPPGALPLPWCHVCPQDPNQTAGSSSSSRLELVSVFCCPK